MTSRAMREKLLLQSDDAMPASIPLLLFPSRTASLSGGKGDRRGWQNKSGRMGGMVEWVEEEWKEATTSNRMRGGGKRVGVGESDDGSISIRFLRRAPLLLPPFLPTNPVSLTSFLSSPRRPKMR